LLTLLFSVAIALAQAQNNGTYRLQPEDIIRIRVYNENQLDSGPLPVGRDGNISAPFLGIVRAEGKTTTELEAELRDLYINRIKLRDPIVSVTIEAFRQIRVTVGGFVSRPGQYTVRPGDTIKTLLDLGGSVPTDGRADLRRAVLQRKGSTELIPIDLYSMVVMGDTTQNYELQDGDQLTVPEEIRNRITVIGRVQNPGVIPYRESMRVVEAVQQAGGEIIRVSRMSKVVIIRQQRGRPSDYQRIEVDLVAFWKGGDARQNILLEAGDYIYVPDAGNIDFDLINTVANAVFILERFGLNIFRF